MTPRRTKWREYALLAEFWIAAIILAGSLLYSLWKKLEAMVAWLL